MTPNLEFNKMNKVLATKSSSYTAPSTAMIHTKNTNTNSSNSNNNTHHKSKHHNSSGNMKPNPPQTPHQQQECHLDELGYCFVKKCIETIETRGLDDQGLYRIGGVGSRSARLLQICMDRKNYNQATGEVNLPDFSDPVEWETKTITSALKNYLRLLSEPLMTFNLHPIIIEAAKIENTETRTARIKSLVQQLPVGNFTLLKILVEHLKNVASHSQKNLMTTSNLAICFAPTLMKGPHESALSIMEVKYSNVVAHTLIEDYDSIFNAPRLPQIQQPQVITQPVQYIQSTQASNCEEQFGLPYQSHQSSNSTSNISHPKKPFKCQNGSNDLAQFALKSYDHTSRPSTFIPNPLDIRPINDLKTYSFDQALMVPKEHTVHHLGGSMNNSLNYIGYPSSQTSSHPHSLNYSSCSLNNGTLGDQYNNLNPMNSLPYYPTQANKLPYCSSKVITLYACVADTDSELSFGPNEIITDGK